MLRDPLWQDLPERSVRKLVRAMIGTKALDERLSAAQRGAIRDAMLSTREEGQGVVRWRARAFGLLRQRGWL